LKPRFGSFARTVPRGLGRGEIYNDAVETFLKRVDNATFDVAAKTLGLPAASLPHNTCSEISLPIRFGGIRVVKLVALADAAHVSAAAQATGSAIRFLKAQDARVRGDTHDDVPMGTTMNVRLAIAMNTAVSRRPSAPDGPGDDNEPMRSLELASAWVRVHATCGSHALAESEPLITTA
jgi:hypothetical protein